MRVEPFSLPLSSPLTTAHGRIERRDGFVLSAEFGSDIEYRGTRLDGQAGVGESTPLPGWTETHAVCKDALEGIERPERALDGLDCRPAARHGVELLLEDASARAGTEPLYRSLGAEETVETVPVNATIGDADAETTAQRARAAVERGFECLKVKVGARPVEADIDRLDRVRAAVGSGVELRADANGAWSLSEAREAFARFAEIGVEYVEQPLAATDLGGHAALRDGSVGVALDESLVAFEPRRILARGAADVLICKPMVLGGPRSARRVAADALATGVDPVVTTTLDGVVARTAAVHVAASVPGERAHGLATAGLLAGDLGDDPAPVEEGAIRVPQDNGLGVTATGDQ